MSAPRRRTGAEPVLLVRKGEIKMPIYSMVLLAVLFAVIYFTVWVIEKIRYMVRKISDLESCIQQLEVRMDSAAEKEDHNNGKEV